VASLLSPVYDPHSPAYSRLAPFDLSDPAGVERVEMALSVADESLEREFEGCEVHPLPDRPIALFNLNHCYKGTCVTSAIGFGRSVELCFSCGPDRSAVGGKLGAGRCSRPDNRTRRETGDLPAGRGLHPRFAGFSFERGRTMDLNEARELRQELEAIEAAMERIKGLWLSEDFPTADDLKDLANAAGGIASDMEGIIAKDKQVPSADDFTELAVALGGISTSMESIIEKADQLPTAEDLGR
jgi:hypothetical protein